MSSINLGFLDFVALITFLVFAKAYWTKHLKPYGLPYPLARFLFPSSETSSTY